MPYDQRVIENRELALRLALDLHLGISGELQLKTGEDIAVTVARAEDVIVKTGDRFYAWLNGTVRIILTEGEVLDQGDGHRTGTTKNGDKMQLHDNEKFVLTAEPVDAKGFDTPDAISWSVDNADVVSLQSSADGKSVTVIAGNPGSAVITVTDAAANLTATEAVDVVPGGTATIKMTEGAVEPQ